MFRTIMTTRGFPAPHSRPDRERVYRFPGREATGPEDREEPTPPPGRGRQACGSPAPGLRLFESRSRSPGEADIGRARRLLAADLTYIAHPSFHDPGARDAILAAAPGHESSSPENGFPSREQEAHRFRRMNYLIRSGLPLQHLCHLGNLQPAGAIKPRGGAPNPVAGVVPVRPRGGPSCERPV